MNDPYQSSPFSIEDLDVKIPYGSHHQHYLINDKYLFAVGVVDILPQCMSSVYSFYDPVLSDALSLGKLTALYEIEWVKRAQRFRPRLKYYYLGYYIHSCQKMRYKAEYKPSELCCPARNQWVDFETAKVRLEERSPVRNCCDISTPDEEYYREHDSDVIKTNKRKKLRIYDIRFDIGAHDYFTINMLTNEAKGIVRPLLEEFVREVGHTIGSQCVVELCS